MQLGVGRLRPNTPRRPSYVFNGLSSRCRLYRDLLRVDTTPFLHPLDAGRELFRGLLRLRTRCRCDLALGHIPRKATNVILKEFVFALQLVVIRFDQLNPLRQCLQ